MASRITTLSPSCGYNPGGIKNVRVIDYDDFIALGFADSALYDSCLVTDIRYSGAMIDVQAKVAKYSGPISGKIVNHTLETFIESLSAEFASEVHLASRRRYVVIFDGGDGKTYVFGYEAGATVNYTGQTDGAQGFIVTFTASSIYPLFEIQLPPVELPDWVLETGIWDNGAHWTSTGIWHYGPGSTWVLRGGVWHDTGIWHDAEHWEN